MWAFQANGPKETVRKEAHKFARKNALDKYAPYKDLPELERKAAEKAIAPEVASCTRTIHYIVSEIDAANGAEVDVLAVGDTINGNQTIDDLTILWTK